ncbi:MAG: hypothetical protein L0Z50_43180 [Verrucomicrobiales bacterium]|nr:hypothetical protein [Verrucomicrobiales bacterium]
MNKEKATNQQKTINKQGENNYELEYICSVTRHTLAALAVAMAPSALRADTITCTSTCNFGPGDVLDNLNVKNGGVATLSGTLVTGSIVVEDGGQVYLKNGVRVEGNVQAFGASWASIKSAVIGGSVQIKNTPNIRVENSTV